MLLAVIAIAVVGSGVAPGEPAFAARAEAGQVHTAVRPADATSSSGGQTTCTANGAGTICQNTYSGDTGWDWQLGGGSGAESGVTPTVTVDQTSNLTNQMVNVSWTGFTPSFNPDLVPGYSYQATDYGVAVFQCKGDKPKSLSDCNVNFVNTGTTTAGATANAVDSYTQGGKSTLFGDCSSDQGDPVCGTGYTSIQVQTKLQNAEMGCDNQHACSIVVEPLWGGNVYALQNGEPMSQACADHNLDIPALGGIYAQDQLSGFTNPCSWLDRIVVPIEFAPTPKQFCSSNYQFTAEGSPMLERVMQQWQPAWCTATQNKVDFNFDSGVNEYQARSNFLSGISNLSASSDAALVTDPASAEQTAASPRKFTYAPIVNTGIVIAYYVDNLDPQVQQPVTNLVLNARLVAKLLTQSYSLAFNQCSTTGQPVQAPTCDPGVIGNPRDIFEDPEFLTLNPGYHASDFNYSAAANGAGFLPIVLAGNSDMTYELTRWIESDKDARGFLQGMPDPWGMHVNTYYENGQDYPISQFNVLDPGYTMPSKDLHLLGTSGYPYNVTMQDAWTPVGDLDSVAKDLASWTATALQFSPVCNDVTSTTPPCPAGVSVNNPKNSSQNFPNRTLFAVMDQGTAAAYRFPTAKLVNSSNNAEGPTYAAEDAALGAMKTNPDKITQYQDFANTAPDAYPLTEVQYAMVPTCGLPAAQVQAVSAFLQSVASSQHYGNQVGQIPQFGGYWALNNTQKAQTLNAAQQVSSQSCTTPPPDQNVSGRTPPPPAGTTPPSAPVGTGATVVPPSPGGHSITSPIAPKPSAGATAPQQIKAIDIGQKSSDDGGLGHYMLPVILILGALLLLGGPIAYAFSTGAVRMPPVRRRPPGGGSAPSAGGSGDD